MISFGFMCLLHFTTMYPSSAGEFLRDTNTVYNYGLPELTKDILERIKAATGRPIDTNYFFPILAASTKNYEVIEYQPYTKTTKYMKISKNNKLDGGYYNINEGDEHAGHEKNHFFEERMQEKNANELEKHKHADHSGNKHKYSDEGFYKKNHHKSGGGKKGEKSKKGRKHGKFHVEKGFRDIYHKDEEKKSDFFWNNQHEEGKWIEYGFKNQKSKKSHDKGGEGRKEKSKTKGSSYEKKEDKCIKCKTF